MVACELRFGEHASNASHDLLVARELVESMINEYGMGASLIPNPDDVSALMNRLYEETRMLLEKYEKSIDKLEVILSEYESISKALARETMNDIL